MSCCTGSLCGGAGGFAAAFAGAFAPAPEVFADVAGDGLSAVFGGLLTPASGAASFSHGETVTDPGGSVGGAVHTGQIVVSGGGGSELFGGSPDGGGGAGGVVGLPAGKAF